MKINIVKAILHTWAYIIFRRPVWMKFSTKYLQIMLLTICEFYKDQCRKEYTSVTGVNEISFMCCKFVWYVRVHHLSYFTVT